MVGNHHQENGNTEDDLEGKGRLSRRVKGLSALTLVRNHRFGTKTIRKISRQEAESVDGVKRREEVTGKGWRVVGF